MKNTDINPIISDAVIVLSNQMNIDGVLNDESKARAIKAVKVFKESSNGALVTCGWNYRNDTNIKIADSFKQYITVELGVDPSKVITEPNSRDTVGDAYFTKVNLAKSHFWKKIIVITSDYHVMRTKEIFNFIYGDNFLVEVIGASIDINNSNFEKEFNSLKAFRKTFLGINAGDDEEILRVLRERHPFYNGTIYKAI
jgi:uncharacterized SAM-binding protein YcdF (DUF218 family)